MRGKPHKEQLIAQAEDLLEAMRNSMNDPRLYKTYAESFKIVRDLLREELPTEKPSNGKTTDTSEFDDE